MYSTVWGDWQSTRTDRRNKPVLVTNLSRLASLAPRKESLEARTTSDSSSTTCTRLATAWVGKARTISGVPEGRSTEAAFKSSAKKARQMEMDLRGTREIRSEQISSMWKIQGVVDVGEALLAEACLRELDRLTLVGRVAEAHLVSAKTITSAGAVPHELKS